MITEWRRGKDGDVTYREENHLASLVWLADGVQLTDIVIRWYYLVCMENLQKSLLRLQGRCSLFRPYLQQACLNHYQHSADLSVLV